MHGSVTQIIAASILTAALVGCGGMAAEQVPAAQEQQQNYHVISIEGVSFEVEDDIVLDDEVSSTRWGNWYTIGDPKGGTTEWYADINVYTDEYSLRGTYDKSTEIDGVGVYVETREYEGGKMAPTKAIVFNYNGHGYDIQFTNLSGDIDTTIEHILETIHFE